MRILHLLYESKDDYFGIGGVGIRAYEIYKHLKDKHDITLLCKKYPGASNSFKEGLRHIFVGKESESLTKTFLSYAYQSALFVKQHGNEFDVIIEEFSPAIPTFLHLVAEKPVVLQMQGYTGGYYFKKYSFFYATVLYCMEYLRPRFYNNFIFINNETLNKFSLESKKYIEIIPNGVSSELLEIPPHEGKYILYFGRIDIYSKGLDLLIQAYNELAQTSPPIRLVIAGDGRDMKRFKDLLNELPKEIIKNIELLGWVLGDQKKEVLKNALFVVFPSRHEVQPISVLEAMACGKAVLVSDIPEFSFVTEIEAGISFQSGDAISLIQSLEYFLTDQTIKEMGKRGREWVQTYTWDKIALHYENFLKRVLEHGKFV